MTSLSNLETGLFYLLSFEWGLTPKEAVPPLYVGNSKGKDNRYSIAILNHEDNSIDVPNKGDCDYYVVVIANKKGDNLILLKGDVRGSRLTFVELAPKILWKAKVDVDGYSDTLFPQRKADSPQGQDGNTCSVLGCD